MNIVALFPQWYISDGCYPPLSTGQLVRLSLEVDPKGAIKKVSSQRTEFRQVVEAEYSFTAPILRKYPFHSETLLVLDGGPFRFYMRLGTSFQFELDQIVPGDFISGDGLLAVDHFSWVEFHHKFEDPPDLFYSFQIQRIRGVRAKDEFTTIDRMPDANSDQWDEFREFLIDMEQILDPDVPLTFSGELSHFDDSTSGDG
jgi:hypothetical protein